MSAKIAELVGKVCRIAETLGRDGGKLEQIGQKLVALSERMLHNVRSSRSQLGWDRRYSNMDRSGQARSTAAHLHKSVHGADDLLHLGTAKKVVETAKNGTEVAVDPSAANLGKLADGLTHTGADRGIDQAKDVGD